MSRTLANRPQAHSDRTVATTPTILVVDDESIVVDMVRRYLLRDGSKVVMSASRSIAENAPACARTTAEVAPRVPGSAWRLPADWCKPTAVGSGPSSPAPTEPCSASPFRSSGADAAAPILPSTSRDRGPGARHVPSSSRAEE
jgi:hypothetical protein